MRAAAVDDVRGLTGIVGMEVVGEMLRCGCGRVLSPNLSARAFFLAASGERERESSSTCGFRSFVCDCAFSNLSVHPSVCLSIRLFVCPSVCMSLSICLSVFVHLSVRVCMSLPICLSVFLSIHVHESVHLSV